MEEVTIYGAKISQPTRAVIWFCRMHDIPYKVEVVNVAAPRKERMGYINNVNPIGRIPAIKDADGFLLYESAAILQYLCGKYDIDILYPKYDLQRRAKIDQYLHWHHENTRFVTTAYVGLMMRVDVPVSRWISGTDILQRRKKLRLAMTIVDNWLSEHLYVVDNNLSIADILCYVELFQIRIWSLMTEDGGNDQQWVDKHYPHIGKWMDRMALLPHHKEVHQIMYDMLEIGFIAKRRQAIAQGFVEYNLKQQKKKSKL